MATQEVVRKQSSNQPSTSERDDRDVAPLEDVLDYLRAYARQKPETAALVCIGIGFVLGWKLKPW